MSSAYWTRVSSSATGCGPARAGERSVPGGYCSEIETGQDWRDRICAWLLEGGCLYVVAWGVECEDWHDTADWTNLEAFDYGDIPDDKFVMTTWHANESLAEALWFAGHCAFHGDVDLDDTIIVHIAEEARQTEMLRTFAERAGAPGTADLLKAGSHRTIDRLGSAHGSAPANGSWSGRND